MTAIILCTLEKLSPGEQGEIVSLEIGDEQTPFFELGFLEGTPVKVAHVGPFGRDPIAVELRGTLLALHRSDAQKITVKKVTP